MKLLSSQKLFQAKAFVKPDDGAGVVRERQGVLGYVISSCTVLGFIDGGITRWLTLLILRVLVGLRLMTIK